jgi:hypothetical protein
MVILATAGTWYTFLGSQIERMLAEEPWTPRISR